MTNFTQLLAKVIDLTDLVQAQTAINNEISRRSAIGGPGTPLSLWTFLSVSQYDYASGNLITNGNCEIVSPAPASWRQTGAVVNATFARSATYVHSGSFAFELAYTAGASQFYWSFVPTNGYTNITTPLSPPIDLITGSLYTFSTWVYVPSGFISSLSNVYLQLQYSTNGTSWNGTPSISNTPTAYDTYQRLIFTFTLPINTTGVDLQLIVNEVGASKAVWVDDIYLRSATPAVVADLRESVNSLTAYNWIEADAQSGYETALAQSEILWKINSLEENAVTCNNACVGFCQGCSNQCGTACAAGCGVACATGCGGVCAVGCGTACASGCGTACAGGCGSACQQSCSSCTGSCGTGCTGTCYGGSTGRTAYTSCSCGSNCSSTCGGSCSSCYSACTTTCGTACAAGCGGACASGCGNTCAGGCGTACTNGCGTACAGGCGFACQTGCGGCSTQCYNMCVGTCGGACTVTCGANCTAIASYASLFRDFLISPYFTNTPGTGRYFTSSPPISYFGVTGYYTASVPLNTYVVVYDSNGASGGTIPIDASIYLNGGIVDVMDNPGDLTFTGKSFVGWCTTADGSGTTYFVGQTFIIISNMILYAKFGDVSFLATTLNNTFEPIRGSSAISNTGFTIGGIDLAQLYMSKTLAHLPSATSGATGLISQLLSNVDINTLFQPIGCAPGTTLRNTYTSGSGTWTPIQVTISGITYTVQYVNVTVIGGGGGGGGSSGDGGGGGGGGLTLSGPYNTPNNQSYAVGSGGLGAESGYGASGGTTSFGSLTPATGGDGGPPELTIYTNGGTGATANGGTGFPGDTDGNGGSTSSYTLATFQGNVTATGASGGSDTNPGGGGGGAGFDGGYGGRGAGVASGGENGSTYGGGGGGNSRGGGGAGSGPGNGDGANGVILIYY